MKPTYLLPALLLSFSSRAQLSELLTLPEELKECSGMEFYNGYLYLHNDGGNPAHLYVWDTTTTQWQVRELPLTNADWEDLAMDGEGTLWIADIGNNDNRRTDLQFHGYYRGEWLHYPFAYEDQEEFPPQERLIYDAEAVVSTGDSLFIFTKNRTLPFNGRLHLYAVSLVSPRPVAVLMDSIDLGGWIREDNWITGADLSPDGKTLALLSSRKVVLFTGFPGKKFFDGKHKTIALGFSQKEALCWVKNNTLWITDERSFGLGGKLYELRMDAATLERNLIHRAGVNGGDLHLNLELFEDSGLGIVLYNGQGSPAQTIPLGKLKAGIHQLVLPLPENSWSYGLLRVGEEKAWFYRAESKDHDKPN